MNEYFSSLNQLNQNEIILDIKLKAQAQGIPIINDEGLLYLMQLIRLTKARNILEIGTAVGYSSINIASLNSEIHIDTIEKSQDMYKLALENISRASLHKQINCILADALEYELNNENQYDLIFIDAAKAQYQKLFCKYEIFLKTSGIIVCDNLLFHGLVNQPETIQSKNLRALVNKIDRFNKWLKDNHKYRTVFINIGDGMAVSEKL